MIERYAAALRFGARIQWIAHCEDNLMTQQPQLPAQRRTDHACTADDQHPPRGRWPAWLRRAVVSGSCASFCSTALLTVLSHRRLHAPAAGTNATSQWFWPRSAPWRHALDLQHTATGFAIHHLCSVFWAAGYEAVRGNRRAAAVALPLAAATAGVAYLVDYKVVPPRLSPGFDQHLQGRDLVWVYAAFAAGLALPTLLPRSRRG